ncbi:MAG TPA: hypothetical protein VGM88_23795 [Kofleriaceae bacterium]|jgi:hypothetical protein
MLTTAFRSLFAATAILTVSAAVAEAKPRHVVVSNFDGKPVDLASAGHASVLSLLGDYDLVSPKRWTDAQSTAATKTHGAAQWLAAARAAGVDAVVEGWVSTEGHRRLLNVLVRDARSGREFDTITVRLDEHGVSSPGMKTLQSGLDDIMAYIDGPLTEGNPNPLERVEPKVGARRDPDDDIPTPKRAAKQHEGIGDDDAADDDAPPPPKKKHHRHADADGDETAASAPAASVTDDKKDKDGKEVEDGGTTEAKPKKVAAADETYLGSLFPLSTDEGAVIKNEKPHHTPQDTPRFAIDAGGYYGSRSITFQAADPSTANLQQAPGVTSKGIELNVAFYPFPSKKKDGILSGIGFTGHIHHSLSSSIVFDDQQAGEVDEYVINQNGYELGIHYRSQLSSLLAVDGGAFYGNQTYQFVDASPDFETPDTGYQYLGLGGHLDLAITQYASVGFGARYFDVLTSGDLESTDFYGPSSASGYGFDVGFTVPLPAHMYVKGTVAYQHIHHEFSGGGIITDQEGVTDGTDSMINASATIGVSF